jgi:hypothetical protein
MLVQTFYAQASIETFHLLIVCWLTPSAKVQFNTFFISPFIPHLTDEFSAIIGIDTQRLAFDRHEIAQNPI